MAVERNPVVLLGQEKWGKCNTSLVIHCCVLKQKLPGAIVCHWSVYHPLIVMNEC